MLRSVSTFAVTALMCLFCLSVQAQIHTGHTRAPFAGSPYLSSDSIPSEDTVLNLALSSRFEDALLRFENEDGIIAALDQRLVSGLSLRFSPEKGWALLLKLKYRSFMTALDWSQGLNSSPSVVNTIRGSLYVSFSESCLFSFTAARSAFTWFK